MLVDAVWSSSCAEFVYGSMLCHCMCECKSTN